MTCQYDSGWEYMGKASCSQEKTAHIFYEQANFYTIETVRQWLAGANLSVIEFRSTLYQFPGCVEQEEAPRESLDAEAGFFVIVARREHVKDYHTYHGFRS